MHSFEEENELTHYNVGTHKDHSTIRQLGIWRTNVFTSSRLDLRVTSKESNVRNTVMIKHHETVIDGVETKLGTNIADCDTLQRSVIFQATDLNAERMRTKVLSINDKSSHDNSVISSLAKTTNPPLARSQGRGVKFELVALVDVRSGSLQSLHVGSVAKLNSKGSAKISTLAFHWLLPEQYYIPQSEHNNQ